MKVRRIAVSSDGVLLDEPSTPWWFLVLVVGVIFLFVTRPFRNDSRPATPAPPAHERTAEEKRLLFWHTTAVCLLFAAEGVWGYRRLRHNIRRRKEFREHAEKVGALLSRTYVAMRIAIAQRDLTEDEQTAILEAAERHCQAKSALAAANRILQSWLPLCEVVWRTGRQTQLAYDLAREALDLAHKATRYMAATATEQTISQDTAE
jgi:hypothetical protein